MKQQYNKILNEIIWSYKRYTASSNKFQNLHDTIFWYSKSKEHIFNPQREEYGDNSGKMDSHYKKDENGQWFRWQKRKDKEPYKIYLSEGRRIGDVWEMSIINASSKERIGYPTQKPLKLLERIITCASNENDVVLDPFVGGGTSIAVADKLNRNWIGIDQSVQAVKVTELRLQNQRDLFSKPFVVQLYKYDYDTLRNKQAFEFETWIIEQFGGTANTKQRNDLGLDGRSKENAPIQVKRSDNVGREIIDKFKSSCERYDKSLFENNKADKKPCGFIIAFSFGKGAIQEVARLNNQENIIVQLVTVAEIVPIAKKPTLTIKFEDLGIDKKNIREIEFIATGASESGIEFFAWDFNYNSVKGFNAEILLDKEGKQTYKFKAGSYSIAVKVIDNEGLENIETVKLKINGEAKATS